MNPNEYKTAIENLFEKSQLLKREQSWTEVSSICRGLLSCQDILYCHIKSQTDDYILYQLHDSIIAVIEYSLTTHRETHAQVLQSTINQQHKTQILAIIDDNMHLFKNAIDMSKAYKTDASQSYTPSHHEPTCCGIKRIPSECNLSCEGEIIPYIADTENPVSGEKDSEKVVSPIIVRATHHSFSKTYVRAKPKYQDDKEFLLSLIREYRPDYDSSIKIFVGYNAYTEQIDSRLVMQHHGTNLTKYTFESGRKDELKHQVWQAILAQIELIHNLGYIHRDLKPENICIQEDGSVILIDFSLSEKSGSYITPCPSNPNYLGGRLGTTIGGALGEGHGNEMLQKKFDYFPLFYYILYEGYRKLLPTPTTQENHKISEIKKQCDQLFNCDEQLTVEDARKKLIDLNDQMVKIVKNIIYDKDRLTHHPKNNGSTRCFPCSFLSLFASHKKERKNRLLGNYQGGVVFR